MRSIYFLGLLLLSISTTNHATEEPAYQVIESDSPFELRYYEPYIIAQTHVTGSMDSASRTGFRTIADYIFGNNRQSQVSSDDTVGEKISMTKPVTLTPVESTTPIENKESPAWKMHFVMPSQYQLETLPSPANPSIELIEVPAKHYAVVRFSGWVSEVKMAQKTQELLHWLETKGLSSTGAAQLARYNPPWTLPPFRRNEIMVSYD